MYLNLIVLKFLPLINLCYFTPMSKYFIYKSEDFNDDWLYNKKIKKQKI